MESISYSKDLHKFKQIDYESIVNHFNTDLKKDEENEHTQNLLHENGLIDPSLLLSLKYAMFKLKLMIEKINYRVMILGAKNSEHWTLFNCLCKENIVPEIKNIFLVTKLVKITNYNKPSNNLSSKLFKCKVEESIGLNFEESELIFESDFDSMREKIIILDKGKKFNQSIHSADGLDYDSLKEYIYILHIPQPEFSEDASDKFLLSTAVDKTEYVIFPSGTNEQLILAIYNSIKNKDIELISHYEEATKESLIEKIQTKTKTEFTEDLDLYFKNYIYNRKTKRNILILVFTPNELISNDEYLNNFIDKNPENILKQVIFINNCENISLDFIQKLTLNNEIESEITSLLSENNKLTIDAKEQLYQKITSHVISNKLANNSYDLTSLNIFYSSTTYTMLSRSHSPEKYHEQLYKKLENNIYKLFSDFKENKLQFLIKKSPKYEESFSKFESHLLNIIQISHTTEVKHFYSCYMRYTTVINDLLNIPLDSCSSIRIKDEIDLKATLILYKNLIQTEYETYLGEIVLFYSEFAKDIEDFYKEEQMKIEKWFNSIYLYTNTKLDKLMQKFQALFCELNLRLDRYYNEIIERDMKLIIQIKSKLKAAGYLNEYISRYLTSIQYSIINSFWKEVDPDEEDTKANDLLLFSGGIGLASGLITVGLTRIVSILASDAISGTIMGPIGTIAGATVGTISLLGTSMYHLLKNKKKLTQKFQQLQQNLITVLNMVYDKMYEFRLHNKGEIESRINKLISYVELSIRKSIKI